MRARLVIIVGAVMATVTLGSAIYLFALGDTITITRTEDGFIPDSVLIEKGDTVIFVNESSEAMWPASNSHPTHTLYSAFDPQQPIEPGETWKFRFKDAGVWKFHDHLAPTTRGVVMVNGKPGEAAAACISSSQDTIKAYCWEPEIRMLINEQGFDAAFDHFAESYANDPVFKRNCHDVGHVLGVSAYDAYAQTGKIVDRPETSYCGFGFYHGFIEAALAHSGDAGLDEGRTYCESLRTSTAFSNSGLAINAANACFHGVGHAIFDSLDGSFWGDAKRMVAYSRGQCEATFTGTSERESCLSGIYNALANAYSARDYQLSFDDPNIEALCTEGNEGYRRRCYAEVVTGYVRDKFFSIEDSFSYFLSLGYAPGTEASIMGIMDDEVRRTIGEFEGDRFRRYCGSFEDTRFRDACFEGVRIGLVNSDATGNSKERIDGYCNGYPEASSMRAACHQWMTKR